MFNKFFKFVYIALIIIFAYSSFALKKLPKPNEVVRDVVVNEPIQKETARKDFSFKYRGNNYHVKPMADYELWGLVVTMNDIKAWYNFYHDENSVNLKDVCVIWGKNIIDKGYLDMNFKSGEWTCYPSYKKWPIQGKFHNNKLSNNHLLSDSKKVRDLIRKIRVGDQIYLKGSLVDYAKNNSSWYRMTSLSRDDVNKNARGGGSCEIFFVDEVKILKQGMPYLYLAKNWSRNIFLFLLALQFLLFNIDVFRKSRKYAKLKE